MLKAITLCHQTLVDQDEEFVFQSSDEEAFLEFASIFD